MRKCGIQLEHEKRVINPRNVLLNAKRVIQPEKVQFNVKKCHPLRKCVIQRTNVFQCQQSDLQTLEPLLC